MGQYHGGVQGAHGWVKRAGSRAAGIAAFAKSRRTRVTVDYRYYDGLDHVEVVARDVQRGRSRVLWAGTEPELLALLGVSA